MLVYGDPHFNSQLQPLRQGLCALAQRARADAGSLDTLRGLLIACGQVEQAAHDALEGCLPADEAALWIAGFHAATAHAAAAFYTLAHCQPVSLPAPRTGAQDALRDLIDTLHRLGGAPDLPVTVKLPEGFSFHALYPEQYLAAAGRWLADHEGEQRRAAVVVGVRSIGAALAAVVSTVLRAAGWPVQSFTVRPIGHPFARRVEMGGLSLPAGALGLVVDEGPGISGSSLAAAAAALVEAGLERADIAFLPGHGNGPGGAGSEAVQSWWQTAPCYVADLPALTFGGLPLHAALAAGLPEPVIEWEDLSGGTWRRAVYADERDWPAVATAFERVKYRATLAGGRRVLFKFLGLAAMSPDLVSTGETAAALLAERARSELAPPVLATALGFVATEWIEGAPIPARSLPRGGPHLATVGAYIARAAGPPLTPDELDAGTARLAEMLGANTHEALGEEAAARARRLEYGGRGMRSGAAAPVGTISTDAPDLMPMRCYGDGHLHPHEWIICDGGRLFKVDGMGHDCDHTLIGKQPVAWDLAGAIIEWELNREGAEALLAAYAAAGGQPVDRAALRFYRAAYLAFRAGQCALAAQVHDPYERPRLSAAYVRYRDQLAVLLSEPRFT